MSDFLFSFWIGKEEPHEIILPSDLQSHPLAIEEKGMNFTEFMQKYNECRWRQSDEVPNIRTTPGEFFGNRGDRVPLDEWLQTVIIGRFPSRDEFADYLAQQAEEVFSKLKGEALYRAGLAFPKLSHEFLENQLRRLNGKWLAQARANWFKKAA